MSIENPTLVHFRHFTRHTYGGFSSLLTNEYQESSYLPAYNPLCLLSSVFCLLSSVFCPLSSVFCLLSSVFCPLSSVLCLLSSVFCPPLHLSRTLYKSHLFMQNKPNFLKSQMNVNPYNTTVYENKSNWTLGKNKPNQSQFPKSQNECKLTYNKGLQKKR